MSLSVVIPAAGIGRCMRSAGAKSLIQLPDGRSVLRRQLDLVRSVYPKADIVVVVGHEAEKVVRAVPPGVRVVENERFGETGVARSTLMGIRACSTDKVLVVYGDMVFNRETLLGFPKNKSTIVVDSAGRMSSRDVGVTLDARVAVRFDFGLPTKWGNISLLAGEELRLFKSLAATKEGCQQLCWEIFNKIVERGGEFLAVERPDMKWVEIDSRADLSKTPKVVIS